MFFKNEGGAGPGTRRRTLPLLPLRDITVFPHMVSQLFVGRERSINALNEAMNRDKEIFLSAQKNAKTNEPSPEDIFAVGTIEDRKSTRLNSSHSQISYAVFCLKK